MSKEYEQLYDLVTRSMSRYTARTQPSSILRSTARILSGDTAKIAGKLLWEDTFGRDNKTVK